MDDAGVLRPARARRATVRRRWWADGRLITGIALAASGVALAWFMWPSSAAATSRALMAVHDLPAGMVIGESDVTAVDVQLPSQTSALIVNDVIGTQVIRPVAAGMLLAAADVRGRQATAVRQVSISIEPGHAPPAAKRGDVVEVWATAKDVLTPEPSRMVARVVVAQVADADSALGDRVFVVQVSAQQSARVVSALRNHAIDLVEVTR
ncbi:MAG: Chaperone for flagella basal body P-ring formation [Actinomycetota bacterium]